MLLCEVVLVLSPGVWFHFRLRSGAREAAFFAQVRRLKNMRWTETQKTHINSKKVNNHKIFIVQGLVFPYTHNSNGKHYAYNLC